MKFFYISIAGIEGDAELGPISIMLAGETPEQAVKRAPAEIKTAINQGRRLIVVQVSPEARIISRWAGCLMNEASAARFSEELTGKPPVKVPANWRLPGCSDQN